MGFESQVAAALSARVRHGFQFNVGGTDIESTEGHPALVVKQLVVKDEAGRPIIRAPQAIIAVDPVQLLGGKIVPNRLDLRDLTVKLSILPDGDIAFSAGTDETMPFRVADAFESGAPGPAPEGETPKTPTSTGSAPNSQSTEPVQHVAASLADLIDKLAGTDEAFGGFDRLGVARGTLILDDRTHNSVTTFRNLELDFDKLAEGASRLTVAADGASGRWSVTVHGTRHTDSRRSFAVELNGITLADLQVIPSLRDVGFDSDVPLSGSLSVGLDQAGAIAVARGQIKADAGFFRLHDPDHEPVMLDSVTTSFHFDTATQRIVVEPSAIKAEETSYRFEGQITPPTEALDGPWLIAASGSGVFGAERPGEKPVPFNKIELAALADPGRHAFQIDRLSLAGPQVATELSARIESGPDGIVVKSKITAGRMPAPVILRLWPSLISAEVRSWLLANVQGGTLERGTIQISLDQNDLAKIKLQHSVADGHLRLDYAVSDMSLGFMAGVPPLRGIVGTGVVTGDTSRFNVARGVMDVSPGHQLTINQGSLVVPSTDPKPTPATITTQVVGPVEVLTELLQKDALKSYAGLPPDAPVARGQIDGTLTVGLKLGRQSKNDDVKIGANARITNLVVEKLIGKQNLTGGDITVVLDKGGLHAKGDAQIFGAPTTLDLRKPAGTDPGQADINLTLDDAARVKAGLNLGRSVSGPIVAKITTVLGTADKKAAIDLDLTRANLNNPIPGLAKASGRPAKLTLVATQKDKGVSLDNIVCDIGTFSVRGSADLDQDGSFQSAHLSQARLSPSDDMKIDATQGSDGLKLMVRGTNIDSRPFLKSLSNVDAPDPGGKDFDLDLKSNVLTGQNSQVVTGVDLHLLRRGGQIKRLQINGRFGRAPVSVVSSLQGAVLTLVARSADAGSSLAFLDLYKKVGGGRLDATVRMLDNRMDGVATIHDFELREDPAMKRLTEETLAQRKSGDMRIDGSNLSFTKLSMNFSKTGGRVEIKDGALFSPQLGATVQGSIDFAHDKLALNGTFVPIYGVNNLFAQLPVLGPILGGGAHEGLFGLNYKIVGQVGNPNLTVDPLSALAPGFLRKIFGAISDAANQDDAPTPDTATGSTAGSPFDPVAR